MTDYLASHVHVSERETAHTWPDGRPDDATWEDCLWASAVEACRFAGQAAPATHAEAEALRAASGEPPTGGSNHGDLARGIAARYGRAIRTVTTADLWAALEPGTAAVVTGRMSAFPAMSSYRRWDRPFAGAHAVFVARTDATHWATWCDPLAPAIVAGRPWAGEPITRLDLERFAGALGDVHSVYRYGEWRSDPMIEAETSYGETWAVAVGAPMFDAPDGAQVGSVSIAQRVTALGAPYSAAGVDYTWRLVRIRTQAGPGDEIIYRGLYMRRSSLTDPQPPAPPVDCGAALEARDEEWRTWMLAGSPGDGG